MTWSQAQDPIDTGIHDLDSPSPLDGDDFPIFDGYEGIRAQAVEMAMSCHSMAMDADFHPTSKDVSKILADAKLIADFICAPDVSPDSTNPTPTPTPTTTN